MTAAINVLAVMASAADGMESVIESEGHFFEDSEPVAMRDARSAVAELIKAADRAYPPGDYSQDAHGFAVRAALARVRGEA